MRRDSWNIKDIWLQSVYSEKGNDTVSHWPKKPKLISFRVSTEVNLHLAARLQEWDNIAISGYLPRHYDTAINIAPA